MPNIHLEGPEWSEGKSQFVPPCATYCLLSSSRFLDLRDDQARDYAPKTLWCRQGGLEPLRCHHGNLNPTCLPIPPYRRLLKSVAGAYLEVHCSKCTLQPPSCTRLKAMTNGSRHRHSKILVQTVSRTVEDVRYDRHLYRKEVLLWQVAGEIQLWN